MCISLNRQLVTFLSFPTIILLRGCIGADTCHFLDDLHHRATAAIQLKVCDQALLIKHCRSCLGESVQVLPLYHETVIHFHRDLGPASALESVYYSALLNVRVLQGFLDSRNDSFTANAWFLQLPHAEQPCGAILGKEVGKGLELCGR